ncbi:UDP-N-acetylglucosamine 1-carboxyvinyltransferase [Anaplasma capra]|uniref:UDP-N-acetylglucosamine 1-carboxyvinyltransferase n=1 Tax=Anaplasma capra TaxID=1562740 RepID=UPI0021D5DCCD|nr:UDP-N-acetylglucosamine 1-carboxyvinyltransferase [Anaplasma capra]MCU7611732.1 UDP-N-acetylglucosamine 1-carboxyvinyltransferase [Anaplasma capra]MCU7612517.1 UDP-N-acetylglucosamine 1-carboxyvinyltransferase [Anaplasma capra]
MAEASLHVRGSSNPICGKVVANGAKNSALPIMAACLLLNRSVVLANMPDLLDVAVMCELIASLGGKISFLRNAREKANHKIEINCNNLRSWVIPHEITSQMRASCLTLGPILARMGKAEVALPGGCSIGQRPLDMHICALEKMGATVEICGDRVKCSSNGRGLVGCHIDFRSVSVGATENALMASVTADGVTTISNAAVEPEVVDLANFLVKAGAQISGIGTKTLTIRGVKQLSGSDHAIILDRMEAGTYALAAMSTGGTVHIVGATSNMLGCFAQELENMGGKVTDVPDGCVVSRRGACLNPVVLNTAPYPGFPSDMQAQFAAAACIANGTSQIHERIFDNRFSYTRELTKMGADIHVQANTATIRGVGRLRGASVLATDLRASAALLIAGLSAKGTTTISNAQTLYRGYEAIEEKLRACGAEIELIRAPSLYEA